MAKNLRVPALNESICTYIKDYILENNLKAGDPLPSEGKLALDLGVSRSTVREAVKALQSLGIVESRHGEGLFVREWNFDPVLETLNYGMRISPHALEELYQIRVWLELAVIGDAIKKVSSEEITELEILMLRWAQAVKRNEPYVQFDEEFHHTIFKVVDNQTLVKFFKVFWLAFENYGNSNKLSHDPLRVLQEHQDIFEAIKKHDPEQARQKLIVSFMDFQQRIAEITARTQQERDNLAR